MKRKKNASYDAVADRKDKAAAFQRRLGNRKIADAIDDESIEHYALRTGYLIENPRRRQKNWTTLQELRAERTAERKNVKAALIKAGYKNVSVGHGRGTAHSWLDVKATYPAGGDPREHHNRVEQIAKSVSGRSASAAEHISISVTSRKDPAYENPMKRKNGLGLGRVIKKSAKTAVKMAILKQAGVLNPRGHTCNRAISAGRKCTRRFGHRGPCLPHGVTLRSSKQVKHVRAWIRKSNAGDGNLFNFHGSFTEKAKAEAKEAKTPGSFIRGSLTNQGYRYMVLTKKNPALKRATKCQGPDCDERKGLKLVETSRGMKALCPFHRQWHLDKRTHANPKRRNGKLLHFPAPRGSRARAAKFELTLTPIIKRALTQTVTDLGHISKQEHKELNAAVKRGWLSKGKGGPFPILKTVYAVPGFNFAADRKRHVDYMTRLAKLDSQRRRNPEKISAEKYEKLKKAGYAGEWDGKPHILVTGPRGTTMREVEVIGRKNPGFFGKIFHKAKKHTRRAAGRVGRSIARSAAESVLSKVGAGSASERRLARRKSHVAAAKWAKLSQGSRSSWLSRLGLSTAFAKLAWSDIPSEYQQHFAGKLRNPKKSRRRKLPTAKSAATAATSRGPRRQQNRRRRNGAVDDAAGIVDMFTGKPADQVIEMQQREIAHDTYAKLGDLVKIVVGKNRTIEFPDDGTDPVMLCCDPKGKQLYIIGGDQDLSGSLKDLGADASKDLCDLGDCTQVEYLARKKFDNFEPVVYFHKLGEESGVKPRLMFDKLNRRLYIVGGEYKIEDRGIVN